MLFMPQNSSVIEFPLRPHIDRCFGYMAMSLGLDYWLVPQVTSILFERYTMDQEKAKAVVRLLRHLLMNKGMQSLIQDSESLRETNHGISTTAMPVCLGEMHCFPVCCKFFLRSSHCDAVAEVS